MSPADRLEAIRARAAAATGGPWHWRGNADSQQLRLEGVDVAPNGTRGWRMTVLDFTRWGMSRARPRFAEDGLMVDGDTRAVFEVAPGQPRHVEIDGKRQCNPKVYRADVVDIDHPDAQFMAHSRADVDWLVAEVDRLRALVEHQAEQVPA